MGKLTSTKLEVKKEIRITSLSKSSLSQIKPSSNKKIQKIQNITYYLLRIFILEFLCASQTISFHVICTSEPMQKNCIIRIVHFLKVVHQWQCKKKPIRFKGGMMSFLSCLFTVEAWPPSDDKIVIKDFVMVKKGEIFNSKITCLVLAWF